MLWMISLLLMPAALLFFGFAWKRLGPKPDHVWPGVVCGCGVFGLLVASILMGIDAGTENAIEHWSLDPKWNPSPPPLVPHMIAAALPAFAHGCSHLLES